MRMLFTITVLALAARAAAADPTVLAVDGDDVFVDLGAQDGASPGAELHLLHVVVARDPTTGQTLRDRFLVGSLVVARAGAHVLIAHAEAALRGKVVVGDEIALAAAPVAYVDPWQARIAAAAGLASGRAAAAGANGADPRSAAARAVDDAAGARAVWQDTLGRPPAERADRWAAYLSAKPDSPYAAAITAEIASLRAQADALDRADAARTAAGSGGLDDARAKALAAALAQLIDAQADAWFSRDDGTAALLRAGPIAGMAPSTAMPGRPITLAFTVVSPARAARAWLYARPRGAAGFTRIELAHDGDAYLRATIPAALVGKDGVEWFVETGADDGPPRLAIGTELAPRVIEALPDLTEPPIAAGRSQVQATLDYVDFDGGLNKGHDQYTQAEVDFTYRFLEPIHAVRLGFGTLSGQGGPKDVIDADPTGACRDANGVYRCTSVDFSYVYTELVWKPSRWVELMLRPQAGLLTTDRRATDPAAGRCRSSADTGDCDFGTGFGLRGRVRFGEENGTSLLLGVGVTSGVGTLFEANYQWAPRPVVPVTLAVQVTDQPVVESFGVRIIADVGWRGLGWVTPSVRVSYQARDIDHAGLSGGVGFDFEW